MKASSKSSLQGLVLTVVSNINLAKLSRIMEMEKNGKKTTVKVEGSTPATSHVPIVYEIELHRVIEQEAYFRAEKDGFRGSPQDYWLAAEKDVHKYF